MAQVIQRAYPRVPFNAPIKYGVTNGEKTTPQFVSSHTFNYSAGGICYETEQPLMPEDEVCIVMNNYSPGHTGPECYRSYLARIRWINPLPKKRKERFAAGARIIARSHEILDVCTEEPRHNCDLCGALMPVCHLQCTDGDAQLCEQCHKHFQSLPKGKIRKCLERFLTGNVV